MAKKQNTILLRWFEDIWNSSRAKLTAAKCRSPQSRKSHGKMGNEIRGPEEFRKIDYGFRSTFPGIHISFEEMVSTGDLVVGYCNQGNPYLRELWHQILRQSAGRI